MRYLKSFRESVINSDDLQDFCDTYLAYLLDDGFSVVIDNKYEDLFTIRLTQSNDNGNWLEKDNLFNDVALDVLFNSGGEVGSYTYYSSADDLINDRIGDWINSNCKIKAISFYVKNKKVV